MAYKERQLTRDERVLANAIRDTVPRKDRLEVCQKIAAVAEDMRERANATLGDSDVRKDVWNALHFPRYRFFDVAIPSEGWLQFAEDRDETKYPL